MVVTLPPIATGNPTIRTFTFTLQLSSPLGNDLGNFSITVVNQNVPVSQGGPGQPNNSRIPVLYNTRPPTYIIISYVEGYQIRNTINSRIFKKIYFTSSKPK
jgi:hypothetical protein